MICKVADLTVEIPKCGGMDSRCKEYLTSETAKPDIEIIEENYRYNAWPNLDLDGICYMESGIQFYGNLLRYNGLMLHASAVKLDNHVYLFSGPSGMGKSTHTKLWQQTFGSAAQIINDDKPALRLVDGVWLAYGTPWSGKNGINQNIKAPVAGICFLKQAEENSIRLLTVQEASFKIISQTVRKFWKPETIDLLITNIERLVRDVPVYELKNKPEKEAALLSYHTMSANIKEK